MDPEKKLKITVGCIEECIHADCIAKRLQREEIKIAKTKFSHCSHFSDISDSVSLESCRAFGKANNLTNILSNTSSILCSVCFHSLIYKNNNMNNILLVVHIFYYFFLFIVV